MTVPSTPSSTPSSTLACRDLCAHLSEYLEGEAAAELCAAINAHLAECPNCRVVVNTLDRTVRLYHNLPAAALPMDAAARLQAVLDLPAPSL